jgi:hypothetical protein
MDSTTKNIRISYLRGHDRNIQITLATREFEGKTYFGLAKYNPSDRHTIKVQPSKKFGRTKAIERLYEAEQLLYDCTEEFLVLEGGVAGVASDSYFPKLWAKYFWNRQ